jgi:hypothetical protein
VARHLFISSSIGTPITAWSCWSETSTGFDAGSERMIGEEQRRIPDRHDTIANEFVDAATALRKVICGPVV